MILTATKMTFEKLRLRVIKIINFFIMKITEKTYWWEYLTLALNLRIVVLVNFFTCQVTLDHHASWKQKLTEVCMGQPYAIYKQKSLKRIYEKN